MRSPSPSPSIHPGRCWLLRYVAAKTDPVQFGYCRWRAIARPHSSRTSGRAPAWAPKLTLRSLLTADGWHTHPTKSVGLDLEYSSDRIPRVQSIRSRWSRGFIPYGHRPANNNCSTCGTSCTPLTFAPNHPFRLESPRHYHSPESFSDL